MTVVPQSEGGALAPRGGGGGSGNLYDVLELVLDRGLVIDAFVRVSLVGIEILKIDQALEEKQIERVAQVRERRDAQAAEAALGRLKSDAAVEGRNLMPAIVEASRVYVTMGEMCEALREVWGTWRETPVF